MGPLHGVVLYLRKGNSMNLLYINTHDTGRMISPYGFDIPTENLKCFAEDATLFTQAFCCGPTCSPSRATLLTGTYPHQNGMLGLAQRGFKLNDPDQHLASFLRANGFQTAISGIQHECGWYLDKDENALHEIGYDKVLTTDSKEYEKEDLHLWDKKNAENAAQWLLDLESSKPFMLSYGMHSTHRPYPIDVMNSINENYIKPPYPITNNAMNRHDHAQYMTSANYADHNFKIVIEALKEKGLYEDTIIIFTTDHGLAVPFNKCNLTDSGIGVSLIMRAPNSNSNGKVIDHLVSHVDIFPTLCDLMNLKKPEYLEGKSIAQYFEDADAKIENIIYAEINFHTSYEPVRCIRNERYKYIRYFDKSWNKINCSNIDSSIPKEFLLVNELQEQTKYTEGLFDLIYDPDEKNNLADNPNYVEVKKLMSAELLKVQQKTNDPLLDGELIIQPYYKVNNRDCIDASSKNPQDYDKRGLH